MEVFRIAYAATGRFTPPVIDHLSNDPFIRQLLVHPPDASGLMAAAAERTVPASDREVLCTALEAQFSGLELHPAVRAELHRLRDERTLTVTTGHQLCLFSGPLYVPYKILNTIRLARSAEKLFQRPVVPVFWMATEDHDLAEVDHAVVRDRRIRWVSDAAGAVGRMPLVGISAAVEEAIDAMGQGAHAAEMATLLRACYQEGRTLADATRRFVHGLFGRFGLIIVDGDDPALKRLFAPVIQEELLNQVVQRSVQYANDRIRTRYTVQAHAREINLFHLRPGHRSRIVLDGDHYQVLEGGPRWDVDRLLEEAGQRPHHFSPNVLLRPVYQETVLPNIAYIGGGGELAYWIQLRWLFQALRVPMPAVFLRTSAATILDKHMRQWRELGLEVEDLFAPWDAVKTRVATGSAGFSTDLRTAVLDLNRIYDSIREQAVAADPTLLGSVEARRTQALRGVERIGKAMVRAAKRDQEVALRRMDGIHAALFPSGGLQERRDNILPLLAAKGVGELDRWLDLLDPLDHRFTLLVEP
jgi:bacillithiol biosynthesis cysteine-adding enzyme BshC